MQPTMPSNIERGQRGQCAHVLAYERTGAALFTRVMKVARAKNLPCYGEAKGVGVGEMCEILGWQVLEPVDLGYGHSVAPVAWTQGDRAVLR
ncbi:hypothetical protein [Nocardia sp. XZ_19_231]|uniref:hypothetical protein n=1 Tax=Nocardia sp. XZ_19_231 TaxID=2769252 RepID=UPI001890969F|nr:hypothetical protein [Nocardia sp. XZ_19_231]